MKNLKMSQNRHFLSTSVLSFARHVTFPTTSSINCITFLKNTSCKIRNCVYALHCTRCTHIPTLYIGETKNACHIRFSQHKHNILSHKDSAISNHFNQPDHNISMLQVSILQSFNVKHKCPFEIRSHSKKSPTTLDS